MPTKRPTKRKAPLKRAPAVDPAELANQRVLEERSRRIEDTAPDPVDLGLGLKEQEPENAAEFLADAWERKAFGDPVATIKRTMYGPDPLLDQSPELKASLEKFGLVDYANATAETIMRQGYMGVKDEVLRRGLRAAIARFGKEKVAEAFRDRILKIPVREVEVDASDVLDPLIMGGNILRDTVQQYEEPGWSYKFLGESCNKILGLRGYEIVKDAHGDPVKAGTLILGRIREEVAQLRRERWAAQSIQEVREIEEAYRDSVARPDAAFGYRGAKAEGVAAFGEGEDVTAESTETGEWLGETRRGGVQLERHRESPKAA
jgi:hypothetical protein